MRTVLLQLVPFFAVPLLACSSTSNKPAADVVVVNESVMPKDTSAYGQSVEIEGRLVHTPVSTIKSVEAYLGVEFLLRMGNREVVLSPSDAVTSQDLIAADGKDVKVTCTIRAGAVPGPDDSYPMDMDGKPMKRPDQCVVSALSL